MPMVYDLLFPDSDMLSFANFFITQVYIFSTAYISQIKEKQSFCLSKTITVYRHIYVFFPECTGNGSCPNIWIK